MTTTLEQLLVAAEEARDTLNRVASAPISDMNDEEWDRVEQDYARTQDALKAELSDMGVDAERLVRVLG